MLLKERALSGGDLGIKNILKKGRGISSESFHIKFMPIAGSSSKFSVIAGLKVSKKAVIRNKIKRRVGEMARIFIPKIKRGYLIVIIVKPGAVNKGFQDLKEDLTSILNKISQ